MKYLCWDEKTITDFSDKNVSEMYGRGYVFTRKDKGVMQQTRSLRINLGAFELSSENRRILKKISDTKMSIANLPLKEYDYKIGKLAKDFYTTKFGEGTMSAQKIKEIITSSTKSNFNIVVKFESKDGESIGFCISYTTSDFIHYSYPFYDLVKSPKDMGLGMMTKTIEWAKEKGLKYIYLGSLQRPGDVYKIQFEGLEWFDGKNWRDDTDTAKKLLENIK